MRRFGLWMTVLCAVAVAPGSALAARHRAVGVRVSPREAVVTIWRAERPRHVMVRGGGAWRYAHRVDFRAHKVRIRVPVGRHARAVRVLVVTWRGSTRLRVLLHDAAPEQPCGPDVDPAPGERPPACWRPYSATSPFNLDLGADPRVDPRSAEVVDTLTSHGPPQHIPAGWAGTPDDWARPAYFAHDGDPQYVLHCTRPWGRCPIEGMTVRVPAGARPAGGGDAHLTVTDSGWVYGLWQVSSMPRGGGELDFSYGGRTALDGDGIGVDRVNGGNAAGFGAAAGILRPEELAAGQIDHALAITVRCVNGSFVYPAVHTGSACASDEERARAPAMGQRLQLAMSDDEIDALDAPAWKKAILRAMAHYGMIVADTGGDSWSLEIESGVEYLSFGQPDKWVQLAQAWDAPWSPTWKSYALIIRDGIDWPSRLRVVEPCVSARSC